MKNVVILGSTGSIGETVLNIIRRNPNKFKIVGLAANVNYDLLHSQTKEFNPEFVGLSCEKSAKEAEIKYGKFITETGDKAAITAAALSNADTIICAIVGIAGMQSVYSAVNSKKQVLLANKEALVVGGEIIMRLAYEKGVEILPLDSEHSAIWQCLMGATHNTQRTTHSDCENILNNNSNNNSHHSSFTAERSVSGTNSMTRSAPKGQSLAEISVPVPMTRSGCNVSKIILTASGGSFFGKTKEQLKKITPKQASKHPNWSMGKKITVDSSTLMNKGLEIIEARWLFNTFNIDYIIHPESIIHGIIEYIDGTQIACLYPPSMEYPISTALFYPERENIPSSQLKFNKSLTFMHPNEETFVLPRLAKDCMKEGGILPTVLNAANEAAVELFLNKKINFLDIQDIVSNAVNSATNEKVNSIEQLLSIHDFWFKEITNCRGGH
ncbi:MAG: 1-deoxy-D-xylulose-5-phosphate reductoisomerase [Firmicutes bacterium]|nr:1-deoxy-D-xylulose-5-phosphate reductoisomerase [Bacillota bacterium]